MKTIPTLFIYLTAALLLVSGESNAQDDHSGEHGKSKQGSMKYAIAIHGGAGSNPKNFSEASNANRRAAMEKALRVGNNILKNGGSSLDAVEKVVRLLENDPQFNAGVGAVFNAVDRHELDASIMDGKTKACGAVASVSIVKNPITLARRVMTDTPHVLLAGAGAEKFARQSGVHLVQPDHFDTPATLKRWNQRKQKIKSLKDKVSVGKVSASESLKQLELFDEVTGSYLGTVGCVALDSHGNLAAATSTGGLSGKKFGRVGDSPIVGAGTYADNATCAVSCTGKGEQFIRHAIAHDVSARIKYAQQSVESAVEEILKETINQGEGGIIAITKDGEISMQFNTGGMARAAADSTGRFEVIWGNAPKTTATE
jgi:beta-aspartyl-peptidase (threonine type)